MSVSPYPCDTGYTPVERWPADDAEHFKMKHACLLRCSGILVQASRRAAFSTSARSASASRCDIMLGRTMHSQAVLH